MELKTNLAASDYITKQFDACAKFYKKPITISFVGEVEMFSLPPSGTAKSYTLLKPDGGACCG